MFWSIATAGTGLKPVFWHGPGPAGRWHEMPELFPLPDRGANSALSPSARAILLRYEALLTEWANNSTDWDWVQSNRGQYVEQLLHWIESNWECVK